MNFYPKTYVIQKWLKKMIQGKVFIQFVVWKDGSIKDVKVVKSIHNTLDKEAFRVVNKMPNWSPGKQQEK